MAAHRDDPLAERLLCHVNLARGFRGGERQTQLLIESFAARGYRQRLVARRGAPLADACSDIPGLEVRATFSQPLLAAAAANGADLLHAHEARGIYSCWLAASLWSTPWLLTRRVDNPFKSSFLRNRAYRGATAIAGVSSKIRQQIEAFYPGIRCDVVADAHANLSDGHRTPVEMQERYAGKTIIGHVGALDHSHKGQGTIIEVAKTAAASDPSLHFILVGDGRDEVAMKAAAEGLSNIEFTGYVSNVDDWLSVFDLFVFPSLHEGLGSTLLDAMSFGLPVVATNVGGIPDIVEDRINGLLIPPEQPDALYSGIREILDDPVLRRDLSQGARAQAERFSPDVMADRYAALYRRMLEVA